MVWGCKKNVADDDPIVSSANNPSATSEITEEGADPGTQENVAPVQKARPVKRVGATRAGYDWRKDPPPKKNRANKGINAAKSGESAKKELSKEEKAKKEAEAKKIATEKAVDGVLSSAGSTFKRCYDQSNEKSGTTTLSFSVHRSGYFMSPKVTGVGGQAARCIENILGKLRVSNQTGDSLSITRTVNFTRY